jgi:hypothetical protein
MVAQDDLVVEPLVMLGCQHFDVNFGLPKPKVWVGKAFDLRTRTFFR